MLINVAALISVAVMSSGNKPTRISNSAATSIIAQAMANNVT